MSRADTATLQDLLSASGPGERDRAWTAFLETHSDLLLRVARSLGGDHDAVMDRYAFVLDALQANQFRRVRAYLTEGRGSLATWLIVVARSLCLDHHRHRYGRPQSSSREAVEQQAARRSLVNLIGRAVDLDTLAAREDGAADLEVRRTDLSAALARVLDTLPVADRMLLRLRFEAELTVPAIARMQGEPSPFRVYRRLDRILKGLRSQLRAAGFDEASP